MRSKLLITLGTFGVIAGAMIYSQDAEKPQLTAKEISAMKGGLKYEFAKLNTKLASVSSDKEKGKEYSAISGLLNDALAEMADSQVDSNNHAAALLRTYFFERTSARSAPQVSQVADEANVELNAIMVSQNAKLIDQNKKMISLLEKLVAKK